MGEDIEEAQEFPMDAAGSRQECRNECFVDIRGRIVITILLYFGTSSVVQHKFPARKNVLVCIFGGAAVLRASDRRTDLR